MNKSKIGLLFVGAAALVASLPGVAGAAGAGAQSFTQTMHKASMVSYGTLPCAGGNVEIDATNVNGVFHATQLANGTFWVTGTNEEDVSILPITNQLVPIDDQGDLAPVGPVVYDTTLPTYTGRATMWFGDNNNLRNGSETNTFSLHVTGSDGSSITFHETAHISASATGVTLSFDKPSC